MSSEDLLRTLLRELSNTKNFARYQHACVKLRSIVEDSGNDAKTLLQQCAEARIRSPSSKLARNVCGEANKAVDFTTNTGKLFNEKCGNIMTPVRPLNTRTLMDSYRREYRSMLKRASPETKMTFAQEQQREFLWSQPQKLSRAERLATKGKEFTHLRPSDLRLLRRLREYRYERR